MLMQITARTDTNNLVLFVIDIPPPGMSCCCSDCFHETGPTDCFPSFLRFPCRPLSFFRGLSPSAMAAIRFIALSSEGEPIMKKVHQ